MSRSRVILGEKVEGGWGVGGGGECEWEGKLGLGFGRMVLPPVVYQVGVVEDFVEVRSPRLFGGLSGASIICRRPGTQGVVKWEFSELGWAHGSHARGVVMHG